MGRTVELEGRLESELLLNVGRLRVGLEGGVEVGLAEGQGGGPEASQQQAMADDALPTPVRADERCRSGGAWCGGGS
jgi:hypothetical protein